MKTSHMKLAFLATALLGGSAAMAGQPAEAPASDSQSKWKGHIIKTVVGDWGSCIFAQENAKDDESTVEGLFVTCSDAQLDPELYSAGQSIAVTGSESGSVTYQIEGVEYPYSVVNATTVILPHLQEVWPYRYSMRRYHKNGLGDPNPPVLNTSSDG